MLTVSIDRARFNLKLRDYAKAANKNLGEAVREEAAFVADRLAKLTPPAKAAEGKKRVAIDIGKVFVASVFFLESFQWRIKTLGERVKEAVRKKDETAVETIFDRSPRLRKIKVESFNEGEHKKARKNGRVAARWKPGSFPMKNESQRRSYQTAKQKLVGLAKAGWAQAAKALGRSIPSWTDKQGTGSVKDLSSHPTAPKVTLTNNVPYFSDLDSRKGIVRRALEGRSRDLTKKLERVLREAAKAARLTAG